MLKKYHELIVFENICLVSSVCQSIQFNLLLRLPVYDSYEYFIYPKNCCSFYIIYKFPPYFHLSPPHPLSFSWRILCSPMLAMHSCNLYISITENWEEICTPCSVSFTFTTCPKETINLFHFLSFQSINLVFYLWFKEAEFQTQLFSFVRSLFALSVDALFLKRFDFSLFFFFYLLYIFSAVIALKLNLVSIQKHVDKEVFFCVCLCTFFVFFFIFVIFFFLLFLSVFLIVMQTYLKLNNVWCSVCVCACVHNLQFNKYGYFWNETSWRLKDTLIFSSHLYLASSILLWTTSSSFFLRSFRSFIQCRMHWTTWTWKTKIQNETKNKTKLNRDKIRFTIVVRAYVSHPYLHMFFSLFLLYVLY